MKNKRVNSVGEVVVYRIGDVAFLMDTHKNRVVRVVVEGIEPDHKTWAESVPKVCYKLKNRAGDCFARYASEVYPSARAAAEHGESVWANMIVKDPEDKVRCEAGIKSLRKQVLNSEKGMSALKKLKLKKAAKR